MKISANWIRDFVNPQVNDRKMADDLTLTGVAVEGFYNYNDGHDLCYEAEVTTNRVDAMNYYGVAREVGAIYDLDLKKIEPKIADEKPASAFPIEIEDPQGCARYTARIVRGVKIGPTPSAIAHRLGLLDQRSINNVADATNYVLNELGQPTHAFDLDKLEGGTIIVRRARDGEILKTLDGVERKLTSEDLVIADAKKALALAGIMGGEGSMITDSTTNVLIESAWFDPATIRKTARRLGMHTDASHRFERGADYGITPVACARVGELIQQSAGGQVEATIDVVARKVEFPTIALHQNEVHRILGVDIPEQEITRILRRLGFGVTPGIAAASTASTSVSGPQATRGSGGAGAAVAESVADFTVRVPSWRLDVEREIDLIEEVARIYGYLKIPDTLPSFAGSVRESDELKKHGVIRQRLLNLGYNESLSTTFISEQDARDYGNGAAPVRLANPLSEEAAYMRTSLIPGLLDQIAYNLNRGNAEVRLFEMGHTFAAKGGNDVTEGESIALAVTWEALAKSIPASPSIKVMDQQSPAQADALRLFQLVKGDVAQVLSEFAIEGESLDRNVPGYYHPGRAARVTSGGKMIALFGQLKPGIAQSRKFKQPVFLAEFLPEALYGLKLHQAAYTPVPKFPAVERDFSFLLPEATEFEKVHSVVTALSIPEMKSFEAVEIFRGKGLPDGKYSFLVRATFQSTERTLTDEEVSGWSQQIIKAVETIGGSLRA